MDIDRLMTAFAERQQLGTLTKTNNQYEVIIDQRMAVQCFQSHGRFYAYSVFHKLPNDDNAREALLEKLLKRNMQLLAEEPIFLCIDEEQDALALYCRLPMGNLTVLDIEEQIGAMANYIEVFLQWCGETQTLPPVAPQGMVVP